MAGRPVIVVELAADARHARDLAAGGLFVPGCALALDADCDLIVRGAVDELALHARVVFRDPQRGAGLEVVGFGPELRERLARLAAAPPAPAPVSAGGDDGGDDRSDDDVEAWLAEWDALADGAVDPDAEASEAEAGPEAHADPAGRARRISSNPQERLRHLSLSQQIKKAHSGELPERLALERMYGKAVWEALLRNPRITAPEVARIARMGMLPRPLIELILGNGGWLQIPEIRRALLANPRLQTDQILRVLCLLPKHELKLAAVQTAYPHPVRDAAKRMLKELS